jgi:hypothetical protein
MVMLSALEKGTKFPEWYPPWNDGKIRWTANPILVLTLDQNDLRPALEYVVRTAHHLDTLLPLVNRCGSIEEAREEARKVSTVLLGGLRVEDKLVNIDEHRATLGRILREGNLLVTNDILKLERVLRIEEA